MSSNLTDDKYAKKLCARLNKRTLEYQRDHKNPIRNWSPTQERQKNPHPNSKFQNSEKVELKPQSNQPRSKPNIFLKSNQATWYWLIMTAVVSTLIAVILVPAEFYPWNYSRNILGTIFVLVAPGFTLSKVLFPKKIPSKNSKKGSDAIVRFGLSIGMSLTLVPLVGLILYHTRLGVSLIPTTVSFFLLTVAFATIAIAREYKTKPNVK